MDIASWLRELGLEKYEQVFAENAIDADVLPDMKEADLETLGVLLGHRKKMLRAIADLTSENEQAPADKQKTEEIEQEHELSRQAERRQLTLMFVDLVGSTALADRLDPEEMQTIIRDYQTAVTEEITRSEGYVAKYMGDGVLAYFGWPQAHEDDAANSVRCALAITKRVSALSTKSGGERKARIGIATGPVVVGEVVGEGAAKEAAVVGGTPNLAARLQEVAIPGSIAISDMTRRLLREDYELNDLGTHELKGIGGLNRVWEVVSERISENRVKSYRGNQRTELVGREQELELLLSRWNLAVGGEGQIVYLSGEAGIGKSSVVQAFRDRIAAEPHSRILSFCSLHHSGTPFYPILNQIERVAGYRPEDTPQHKLTALWNLLSQGSDRVEEAVSLIAQALQIPIDTPSSTMEMSPQQQRSRTIETFMEQVQGLASKKPLLIALEDCHWIDPSTEDFYEFLIDRIQKLAVLVIITFRPSFSPRWVGSTPITHLSLNRLTERQGEALLNRITGGKDLPDEIRSQILKRTDGVPLFVEELARTMMESGFIAERDEHYELVQPVPEFAIPETLHDSLMARLDRLAPVKSIAQISSIIGREFSEELLEKIASLPLPTLQNGLDQLVDAKLILRRETSATRTYVFRHALIQEAAYQSLLKSSRTELHAKVTSALEDHFPDIVATEPEIVAHHAEIAGFAEKAIKYWSIAGESAMKRSANAEAARYVSKGLDLLRSLPSEDGRDEKELELQLTLGPPLMASKGHSAPEVGQLYERISELGQRVSDNEVLFRASWGSWRYHFIRAEHDEAHHVSERCVIAARELGDPARSQVASLTHGGSLLWRGSYEAAVERLKIAIGAYQPKFDRSLAYEFGQDPSVTSIAYLAYAELYHGLIDEALRKTREALELAEKIAHPATLAAARTYAAMNYAFCRDWPEALRIADQTIEISEELGFPQHLGIGLIVRGRSLAELDDAKLGAVEAEKGLALRRSIGSFICDPYFSALYAEALLAANRINEAFDVIRKARSRAEQTNEGFCQPEIPRTEGLLWEKSNDRLGLKNAIACYREALDLAIRQGGYSLALKAATNLAPVLADIGQVSEARNAIKPVFNWFTEGFESADYCDAKKTITDFA